MKETGSLLPFDIPQNLPIEQEDIIVFNEAIQLYNPPEGWLQRVISLGQFIDRPEFERDLNRLAELASEQIKGPYAVMLSLRDKSDYWIYELLLSKGLPEASLKYDHEADETGEQYFKRGGGKSLTELWIENLPEDMPICTFDDFSISGAQIRELLSTYDRRRAETHGNRYNAFLLYATDEALQDMARVNVNANLAVGKIRTLNQFLAERDIDFLSELDEKIRQKRSGIAPPPVLFWTWYKVPDSIPPIFTGDGLPPLIRPELYREPYKSQSAQA